MVAPDLVLLSLMQFSTGENSTFLSVDLLNNVTRLSRPSGNIARKVTGSYYAVCFHEFQLEWSDCTFTLNKALLLNIEDSHD